MNDLAKLKSDISQRTDGTRVEFIDGKLPVIYKLDGQRIFNTELMMQAEMTMMLANSLHTAGNHRDAFGYAIRAARELFTSIGTSRDDQKPLRHLFDALTDIDKGRLDQALDPGKVANRKVEPSSEWNARACLCAALQARMGRGEKERDAAEAIRRKFVIVPGLPTTDRITPVNRIIEWRKQFKSTAKRPSSGESLWKFSSEIIERAKSTSEQWLRDERLMRVEANALEWAADYRARVAPAA